MSISRRKRFRILLRDEFTCRYCGRSAPQVALQVDHIQSRHDGGSHDDENLATACFDCNIGKGAASLPVKKQVALPQQLPTSAPDFAGWEKWSPTWRSFEETLAWAESNPLTEEEFERTAIQ